MSQALSFEFFFPFHCCAGLWLQHFITHQLCNHEIDERDWISFDNFLILPLPLFLSLSLSYTHSFRTFFNCREHSNEVLIKFCVRTKIARFYFSGEMSSLPIR